MCGGDTKSQFAVPLPSMKLLASRIWVGMFLNGASSCGAMFHGVPRCVDEFL